MELTRNECLDCHVIYPGNENHSCKKDKISCGSFKKALLKRYIKENGASTSNVQYVRGTQTVDSNILSDNSVKHAESRCHTEDRCSDDYSVNMIPNSKKAKFPEWEHGNLHYNTNQKQFSNPNSLREDSAYIFPIEQHSIALQPRDLSNSYLGSPVSADINVSKLNEETVFPPLKNTASAPGIEDNNTESNDKNPPVYDPEFPLILQAHNEQPSSNNYNRVPVEVYRMKMAESNHSVQLNNDNYKHKSLGNDCIVRLISSTNTSKVEDISETLGFADGQNDVSSANESNESPNNEKLVPSISDANRVSDTSGLNFETQYRIENRRYICLLCDKSYSAKSSFVVHFRTHSGEKPYVCDKCGKRFAKRSNFKRHELTHTGEKRYVCKECGKRFAQKQTLDTHLLTHTGEKPFVCNECGKGFALKKTLKKHLFTHIKEKSIVCSLCQKTFSRGDSLVRHKRTHTGEKSH